MIRFRVIITDGVKRNLKVMLGCLLVVVLIAFGYSKIGKGKHTVFNAKSGCDFSGRGLINCDDEVIRHMLFLAMPAMGYEMPEQRDWSGRISSSLQRAVAFATNVDIYTPENILSFHLPYLNMVKAQSVITSGSGALGDPVIESEDESSSLSWDDVPEQMPIKKVSEMDTTKPLVLIFHTHTSESFTPSELYNYTPRDKAYHTEDLNFSIAKVGEHLTGELVARGIPTLHDKTVHDIPTYTTSYSNSLKTVEKLLEENPSINVVIDLHRDAPVVDTKRSRDITTVKIDDQLYSRFMFVVGTDKNFPHPHWKENHSFALELNTKLEEEYPGISRGIDLRTERFNQHVSKRALLIEVGSHGNTMEESLASGSLLAEVLAEMIHEMNLP